MDMSTTAKADAGMQTDQLENDKARLIAGQLDAQQAAALFARLPEVQPEDILGEWRGEELRTGHPMEGLLDSYGWLGKRFDGVDEAHPLVFRAPWFGRLSLAPPLLFMGLGLPDLITRSGLTAFLFRHLMCLFATRKPRARLRMTRYLGRTTATMMYDQLPINDAFVVLDTDRLLGAMDMKGSDQPYFFMLRRATGND